MRLNVADVQFYSLHRLLQYLFVVGSVHVVCNLSVNVHFYITLFSLCISTRLHILIHTVNFNLSHFGDYIKQTECSFPESEALNQAFLRRAGRKRS